MAQPNPGQASQAQSHVPSVAGGSAQLFTQADLNALSQQQPGSRNLSDQPCSYIPSWSHPRWQRGIRFITDGVKYAAIGRRPGDSAEMRPALLPQDEPFRPTEYARRFGIRPQQAARDQWAHSSMTPAVPDFQTSQQPAEADRYDESLQYIMFGNTTAELTKLGIYNPLITGTPIDLDDNNSPINTLFAKAKWTQVPPVGRPRWAGFYDVRYGSTIDGTGFEGRYDVNNNPLVWEALQPALRLASKIIASDHPYWLALTNIFHYRPVDVSKDGRTDAQRTAQGGVPYMSVWMDPNDGRAPAPYPEMANLKARGFNDTAARAQCLRILNTYLSWSFFNDGKSRGMEQGQPDDPNNSFIIRIHVAAYLLWPLLVPQVLSESERVAHTFTLANTLLHELAHAVIDAQRILLTSRNILRQRAFLDGGTIDSLIILGDQIFGGPMEPFQFGGGTWRRGWPWGQVFTEDAVQGEDGLNLEKELWGNRLLSLPLEGDPSFVLKPVVVSLSWPGAHPQPFQQGQTVQDQRGDAYQRWLASPDAPAFSEISSIPVAWYAGFLQQSWWTYTHQKYLHQSLRLAHQPQSDTSANLILPRIMPTPAGMRDEGVLNAVFGPELYQWLTQTALTQLGRAGQVIIAKYVTVLMAAAAEVKMLMIRLRYEDGAWATKQRAMNALAGQVQTSYLAMYQHITTTNGALSPTATPFALADAGPRIQQMNNAIRPCLQLLMELDNVLHQETAYQQNILHLHLSQQPAVRQAFFPLLTNFRARIIRIANLLNGRTIPLVLATAQPPSDREGWAAALQQKVIVELIQPNPVGLATALATLPPDVIPQTQRLLDYMDDLRALHQRFQQHTGLLAQNHALAGTINADGSLTAQQPTANANANGPELAAVPHMRRRQGGSLAACRPAALLEMSRLREGPLKRLVSETLRRLAPFFGDGLRELQQVVGVAERRQALMDRVRLVLQNEAQARCDRQEAARDVDFVNLGAARADDVDATPAELQARILDMATLAPDRAFLTAMWTVQNIQNYIDTAIAELLPA